MAKRLPIYLISVCVSLCLLGSQCKRNHFVPDNPYGLPNINELGTMGCLVNGTVWIAAENGSFALRAQSIDDTIVGLVGQPYGYYAQQIYISVKLNRPGVKIGVNLPVDSTNFMIEYATDSTCPGPTGRVFETQAISGVITLTQLDTSAVNDFSKNIFSGTFSAIIPLPGCDTLKITEGRFSVNFYKD